jgi:hypothetical protein
MGGDVAFWVGASAIGCAVAVHALCWAAERMREAAGHWRDLDEEWRERLREDGGLAADDPGRHRSVREAERIVRRAWERDPAVRQAQAVVDASRRRLGHLYGESDVPRG